MTTSTESIDLAGMLDKQKKAQLKDPYPSSEIRQDRIQRVADMLKRHEKAICDAAMADYGRRSAVSTQFSDILPILNACKYTQSKIPGWMASDKRKSNFPLAFMGAKSKVEYLPLGVVGNISPWNFPVQLAFAPLVDIFAAGNRAMLKPSELSEQSSDLIAQITRENFDPDELTVALGGADVAAQFSLLPFDHLLFTGSTHVGKIVAQSAAANLVPVTLELGGKNPAVVSSSANISLAAEKIMWGKTMNGGQVCLSPDTVLVAEEKLEEFVSCCKNSITQMFPDISNNEDYTHAINIRQALRLRELIADAKNGGVEVISLGEGSERCVPPVLIINPKSDSQVMAEEVFGGPLIIITYKEIDEAVDFINARPKPLALYYFGEIKAEIDQITFKTSSGGLVINDCLAHQIQHDLPFGGVGHSGMGAYHGFDGFKNFSHARAVYSQTKLDPFKFVRPPYTDNLRKYVAKQFGS